MKRKLNPHEARLVRGIIEDPRYDGDFDSYGMASDIVRAINQYRERESLWVAAAAPDGRPPILMGPYTTYAQATEALDHASIGFGDTPVRRAVMRVQPGLVEDAGEEVVAAEGWPLD